DLGADTMPQKMLASTDGDKHRMRRSIVAKFFTPGALKRWESSLRLTVDRLLEEAAEGGTCDFLRDIAGKLPIVATCDLLGIASDEAAVLTRTLASANPESPETL